MIYIFEWSLINRLDIRDLQACEGLSCAADLRARIATL
jgi:hypothetical protein